MRARFLPLVLAFLLPSGARAATWWEELPFLGAEDVLVLAPEGAHRDTIAIAKREGFVVVDLSDQWAPFIFSETDDPATAPKPNPYRATFLALANDGATPDQVFLENGYNKWKSCQSDRVPDLAVRRPIGDRPSLSRILRSIHFGKCLSIVLQRYGTISELPGQIQSFLQKERSWELFVCTIANREARTRAI